MQSYVPKAQVVCEEAPEPRLYGARTRQKQRFVAGVISPAQPHYLYGLLDANTDLPLGGTPPILGMAASATGYKVACFYCCSGTVRRDGRSGHGGTFPRPSGILW